ncbi:nitroreductase/quinone reductase family protein [Yinghuangia aomiensis]
MWIDGMNHVLIHTVGRRTGNLQGRAAVLERDKDGHRVVVASFAGAPQKPGLVHQPLGPAPANPQLLVRVQGATYWSDPRGPGRRRIHQPPGPRWPPSTPVQDYQANCDRRIPLVRLPETVRIAVAEARLLTALARGLPRGGGLSHVRYP